MTTPDEGLDKAALLLMTLGADAAAGVLRQLGPREVQKLSLKMSEMTPQARSAVEPVLAEMIESFGRGAMIQSDENQLREMLTKALGDERAGHLLSRMVSGSMIPRLAHILTVARCTGRPSTRCAAKATPS